MQKHIFDEIAPWLLVLWFGVTLYILDVRGGDVWLSNVLYLSQGGQWLLREHWLTELVLHKGARVVNYLALLYVLYLTIVCWQKHGKAYHKTTALVALLLSLLTSFILVALLKSMTNKACPWDLQLFGGTEPYYHLFQSRPNTLPISKCFPAGHASVGYAWVALYYFFRTLQPLRRWRGLSVGLLAGLVLGFNQQLRGAHFLSHDITTLFLCWLVATGWFQFLCPNVKAPK